MFFERINLWCYIRYTFIWSYVKILLFQIRFVKNFHAHKIKSVEEWNVTATFNRRDGTSHSRNEKFKALKLVLDTKGRGAGFHPFIRGRRDTIHAVSRDSSPSRHLFKVYATHFVIYPPCILAPCIDLTLLKRRSRVRNNQTGEI